MDATIWQLNDVSLISGRTARLSGIELSVRPGVTAVLGASGAGKSSLLSLLAGFERPTSGSLEFVPQSKAAQLPLFWSPQDHGLWPKLTAREHFATVRPDAPQVDRSVDEWLSLLRLSEVAEAMPHRLSQGERSRLSLGRALASEAACLVLDEPLAHVDPIHCRSYLDLIAEHATSLRGTVVFSTHDPASVLRIAEQVICLSETRCVFSGLINELYFNPPTEETAWLLGPANWLAGEKASMLALIVNEPMTCVRPHELVVVNLADSVADVNKFSRLELVEVNCVGELREVLVRDASNAAFRLHSTRGSSGLTCGSRLRIRFEADSRRATKQVSRRASQNMRGQ